ncbi:4522_t:CDS:2 [Scutellospora calospora]|uniref:4522_t:CDS:1 n=1 Tax=Scutellospora calospora TaxID=85575 RepID=A0ACA9MG28_9GLOM|nr:4522_t:CDS:2 [Scutellospora calospora]
MQLFCFEVDRKYDLNSDSAPVQFLVVKDYVGYGTLIVFGISNKENQHTIRLAVEAVKQNIPCQSRSKEEAIELSDVYELFIRSLSLSEITKEYLCNDMFANWLFEEWINCFIDSGWLPSVNNHSDIKPITTNNLIE